MRILLINTNRMQPPVAPLGLDYVAAVLQAEGHEVELLDLCFEAEPAAALNRVLGRAEFGLIGLSFRNTDDCYYPGRSWFVPQLTDLVQQLRALTVAPIVVGGVGFSIMPQALIHLTGADGGIIGDAEFAFARVARGETDVPGVLWRREHGIRGIAPIARSLETLPPMRRDFVDNPRYYRAGGQIGFETKRGCASACIYCADPVGKGHFVRLRPPAAVAYELGSLAARDIVHLHTCDAEFNRPGDHALAICEALIEGGLGSKLRWYAYCAPTPFSNELAAAMARAGCVGINFGVDSGDETMLHRLGRDFGRDDIRSAVELCKRNGMACMLDLLLGGPGETATTVRSSLEFIRKIEPDRVGLSVGLRVYPGTPLARLAAREPQALHGPGATCLGLSGEAKRPESMQQVHGTDAMPGPDLTFVEPTYYISPGLGAVIFPLVADFIAGDPRFFFSDPTGAERNYNYSENNVLVDAIARGYRGAYWDILRRLQEGLPPV